MIKIIKVTGESLSPSYKEGDFVLVLKIPFILNTIRQGDVVVFRHSSYGLMIKRVERLSPDGEQVYVIGTRPDSTDSRKFGPVHKRCLIGKVAFHLRKPNRSDHS